MVISKAALPRRTFLRGVGATLALPLLDAMVPAFTPLAKSAAAPVPRLGFIFRPNGYIRQWLILGPIAFGDTYDAETIDKEQIPNEANITPKEGDKITVTTQEGNGGESKPVKKELTWKRLVTSEYLFDFNEFFKLDMTDNMGGYAVAYLDAPEEMKDITFSLCSNDNGLIYLNGKNIYKFVGGRGLSEDADTVEKLTLKKGLNTVIFKVWNDANNWQGCLRLITKEGKPVKGVKVTLAK